MAPQAAAHRRGGTHRVRDVDRTDSVYDNYNYRELLNATKERGLYRKDMKKVEMAIALRDDDAEKKRAERYALIERQRREHEHGKEKKRQAEERRRQYAARRQRRIEKERRKARKESVDDCTTSDDETEAEQQPRIFNLMLDVDKYYGEKVRQILSDDSWDSTSTESPVRSVNQLILPDCKLRLFEWPYLSMPLLNPPPPVPPRSGSQHTSCLDKVPWEVAYAPLKVITTITKQKLSLPGQKYPSGVDPNYVPVLPLQTRIAARNGVLDGILRKATIEKATDWGERTQIQGWNARMYFHLPLRNKGKNLADTYTKWHKENRKLLRVKGQGDGVSADRKRRHAQRHTNKGKQTAEVYEACEYRPLAMCYIPSYLDFDSNLWDVDVESVEDHCSLDNLFFVRFPGCDVPHYYFWTRDGEWADPTVPNDTWNLCMDGWQNIQESTQKHPRQTKRWVRIAQPESMTLDPLSTSFTVTLATTLSQIEHELCSNGLAQTLAIYRSKWLMSGKKDAWKILTQYLPTIYPSGQMPGAPPLFTRAGAGVAMKLAMIEYLGRDEQTPYSPLSGNEAWTRNDSACWELVEFDEDN
ncbi:hypothetical protein BKA66DRAFT_404902 [Pyrenochaeta sp. MPI-SDFR-AT-0127]|nr:hypothetical protein BKA66DRAFT_404902 [Pyrenochaeta sp. MPI-SDFR-AT-0127]